MKASVNVQSVNRVALIQKEFNLVTYREDIK